MSRRDQWLSPWSTPVSSGSVPGAGHTGCGEVRMWWKEEGSLLTGRKAMRAKTLQETAIA